MADADEPPPLPPKPGHKLPVLRSGAGKKARSLLESQLLSSLECPVCMEYMVPPIPLCENGHSVCGDCAARCSNCPTCRSSLLQTTNLTLEALARRVNYPCRFADEGCQQRVPPDMLERHLRSCDYRPLGCPLNWGRVDSQCPWSGLLSAVRDHLQVHHPRRFSEFPDTDERSLVWEITQAGCFRDYTHVVLAFGQTFVYHKRFNMRDRKLYFAVARAGPVRPGSAEFRYKYKTSRQNGQQCLSLSAPVHSVDDDLEALLHSGAGVAVDFDALVLFGKGAERLFSIRRVRPRVEASAAAAAGSAAAGTGARRFQLFDEGHDGERREGQTAAMEGYEEQVQHAAESGSSHGAAVRAPETRSGSEIRRTAEHASAEEEMMRAEAERLSMEEANRVVKAAIAAEAMKEANARKQLGAMTETQAKRAAEMVLAGEVGRAALAVRAGHGIDGRVVAESNAATKEGREHAVSEHLERSPVKRSASAPGAGRAPESADEASPPVPVPRSKPPTRTASEGDREPRPPRVPPRPQLHPLHTVDIYEETFAEV